MARIFTLSYGKDASGIAHTIRSYLTNDQNMDTQLMRLDNGEYLVQARVNGGSFRQWVGLDKAVNARVTPVGTDKAILEVGSGKWIDKGLTMAVSMMVLWPLAVTSGIGMYMQGKLPDKIARAVEEYLVA